MTILNHDIGKGLYILVPKNLIPLIGTSFKTCTYCLVDK